MPQAERCVLFALEFDLEVPQVHHMVVDLCKRYNVMGGGTEALRTFYQLIFNFITDAQYTRLSLQYAPQVRTARLLGNGWAGNFCALQCQLRGCMC